MQSSINDRQRDRTGEVRNGLIPREVSREHESQSEGLSRVGRLILAGVFFVLGALGAVLPLLPATPFLLLTSYFLVRSSPRLNAILLQSRFFGPILSDWQVHRGVRKHIKVKAVIIVVITVNVSLYLTGASTGMVLTMIAVAMIGIAVILRLPEPGS